MARLTAGITGKAKGSVGVQTFQEARTTHGKRLTVREKPWPRSVPTPDQETARDKFRTAVYIAKTLEKTFYAPAFSQLQPKRSPYQILLSWILDNLEFSGSLWHLPRHSFEIRFSNIVGFLDAEIVKLSATAARINWSNELVGDHCDLWDLGAASWIPTCADQSVSSPWQARGGFLEFYRNNGFTVFNTNTTGKEAAAILYFTNLDARGKERPTSGYYVYISGVSP